ncbi:MAG: DUF2273 domain-containing protein [Clostridiales bacterium]|nr:DUF2273 domain-containing protein [Clostridiales bacterium]
MNEIKNFCLGFIKEHTMSVLLGLLGLVVGILWLTIGFFRTLLLALLCTGGAFVGAYWDKRKKREKNNEASDELYRFDDYRG